jgi:hypothetical protein
MQKFRVRKGCIFRCAWLPPILARVPEDMATELDVPAAPKLLVS